MRRRHTGARGRQEELENFATMRHMARARLDEHVPATVQLPTASSVGFSHEAVHRAIWLFPCPPAPPSLYLIRQPILVLRSRSTSLENALSVPFLTTSFSSSEPHSVPPPSSHLPAYLNAFLFPHFWFEETALFYVVPLRRGTQTSGISRCVGAPEARNSRDPEFGHCVRLPSQFSTPLSVLSSPSSLPLPLPPSLSPSFPPLLRVLPTRHTKILRGLSTYAFVTYVSPVAATAAVAAHPCLMARLKALSRRAAANVALCCAPGPASPSAC